MSVRELTISEQARLDYEDILVATEQRWSAEQADRYEALINDAFDDPLRFPLLGRKRDALAVGIRSFPVGEHVIYYRVSRDTLIVRRILHARREVDRGMVI